MKKKLWLFAVLLTYAMPSFAQDAAKTTYMMNEYFWNSPSMTTIRQELDDGADINAQDAKGMTPLMFAAKRGYADIVGYLIQRGADLEAKDKEGMTALMIALYERQEKCAEVLIKAGADVNTKDIYKQTPLIFAAVKGLYNSAADLIDKGADLNATDDRGITPLMFAVHNGQTYVVHLLLEKGADVRAKDKNGISVFTMRPKEYNPEVNYLLEKYKPKDAVWEIYLSDGKRVIIPLKYLFWGASGLCGILLLVFLWYRRDLIIGWRRRDSQQETPPDIIEKQRNKNLITAVRCGDTEEVLKLLEEGADVGATTSAGVSILMIAADKGYEDIVILLCQRGASVLQTDHNGKTATDYAKAKGHRKIIAAIKHNASERRLEF